MQMLAKTEKPPSFVDISFKYIDELWDKSQLKKIRNMIKWTPFEHKLEQLYSKDTGRPAWDPVLLLRCLLLAEWHTLSDPALEQALAFRLDFKKFVGLDLDAKSPDETTFVVFRKRIQPIWNDLLGILNRQLEHKGFEIHKAVAVDATLVEAHSKPKKDHKNGDRTGGDSDGSWRGFPSKTVKNDDGQEVMARRPALFGYKINMATSVKHGFISGISICTAKEHEIHHLKEFVKRNKTEAVYADKGYSGLRKKVQAMGLKDGIQAKGNRGHKLTRKEIDRNKRITKKRRIVEGNFGSWKQWYGWVKARFMGLARNQVGIILTALAWNMKKMALMT
jgi:IS5 family transposase